MTLLNSIVALEALSKKLFPGKDCGITRIGLSLAFGNFGLCWFGGLPSCHGVRESIILSLGGRKKYIVY